MLEPFDTDVFISEIESHPCLWDYSSEVYSNRIAKVKAWEKICLIFDSNFRHLSSKEKNERALQMQKKWKSLRDSYNRELRRMKDVKSGDGSIRRKKYMYFAQLSFLNKLSGQKEAPSSIAESSPDRPQDVNRRSESREEKVPAVTPIKRKKRRKITEDEKLTEVPIKNCTPKETCDVRTDDDHLFCLSLASDLRKVPEKLKTDAKCELLQVLKKYKSMKGSSSSYFVSPMNNVFACPQPPWQPVFQPESSSWSSDPSSSCYPDQPVLVSPSCVLDAQDEPPVASIYPNSPSSVSSDDSLT